MIFSGRLLEHPINGTTPLRAATLSDFFRVSSFTVDYRSQCIKDKGTKSECDSVAGFLRTGLRASCKSHS